VPIACEEVDEACYWFEGAIEGGMISGKKTGKLLKEADELTAILTASIQTTSADSDKI